MSNNQEETNNNSAIKTVTSSIKQGWLADQRDVPRCATPTSASIAVAA